MTQLRNESTCLAPGATIDFAALLAQLRAMAPRCTDCGQALPEPLHRSRGRATSEGCFEPLCRACAWSELAERLDVDLPR